jgi:hypothetical protein
MRTQGFILVRPRMSLRPVGVAAARIALHRSARSRGYKLSREEADLRSLGRCVFLGNKVTQSISLLDVAPTSPFIVPKGRARVTFVVKR